VDHRIHTGPAHQESVGDPRSGERPGQERHERYGDRLGPMIVAGLVATCGVIEFELGWATRSGKEFEELRRPSRKLASGRRGRVQHQRQKDGG